MVSFKASLLGSSKTCASGGNVATTAKTRFTQRKHAIARLFERRAQVSIPEPIRTGTALGHIKLVMNERPQPAPDLQERRIVLITRARHLDGDERLDAAGAAGHH